MSLENGYPTPSSNNLVEVILAAATKKVNRTVELDGHVIDLREIERFLLKLPMISGCAVRGRQAGNSGLQLVAYLVCVNSLDPQYLQSYLKDIIPADLLSMSYVRVSQLPLAPEGEIDEAALVRFSVLDTDVSKRWEEQLKHLPNVDQVVVGIQDRAQPQPRLHLCDLLPEWKTLGEHAVETWTTDVSPSVPKNHSAFEKQGLERLAVAQGEPLQNRAQLPATLPHILQRAAMSSPEKGVVYLQPDDSECFQSYPELLESAQRVLAGLRSHGLQPQDKVIFQLPHNQDFVTVFWGCLLGGFVPVPLEVAPTYQAGNSAVKKLHNVWQMLARSLIVTSQDVESAVSNSFMGSDATGHVLEQTPPRLVTCETLMAHAPDTQWHESEPADLALLLLTSGSTGTPKGVMLSHHLILYRAAIAAQRHRLNQDSVSINWLPLDHVSGIAQFHVRDIYLGCQQIHAPTDSFLQNPLKWLDWIERFKVNISWAPNFAYGLVNDRASEILSRQRKQRWDLSTMQIFLNAGEAIAPQTARRFMTLLMPHGLPSTAMHPAWGMSETAGAVVYSDRYCIEADETQFVETGSPGPDLSVRIVDGQTQVVCEGVIGALQIKGPMVTSGYYQNSAANEAAFTDDGWFSTGDLACIRDGRVTITGRQKDVIIINGLNYYCHEIEAVVEEIEGVTVSYTAACGFRMANRDTDQLAIFFHSTGDAQTGDAQTGDAQTDRGETELLALLAKIRGSVVKNVGVNPTHLIPVEQAAIPKTGIGKIQRSQLKQRLEAGEFDSVLKDIDLLSENANTLPNWFYQPVWRRQVIEHWHPLHHWSDRCLIFLDALGLGDALCEALAQIGQSCIRVEIGTHFVKESADHYHIDPHNPEHYQRLWSALKTDDVHVDRIVHLWTYGHDHTDNLSRDHWSSTWEKTQAKGLYSLLALAQVLENMSSVEQPVRLLTVSSKAQAVNAQDTILPTKTSLLGLLQTIPPEMPHVQCSHLDLPRHSVEAEISSVLQELWAADVESEVAYRDGERWVPRLQAADLSQATSQELPFKQGGMYVITGGLGEIGRAIATYLLQQYQAKLLLVGRTSLSDLTTLSSQIAEPGKISEKSRAYLELEQLSGSVQYAAVDVCDFPELQQAVTRAATHWHCEVDGVIHLAGLHREKSLVDETPESIAKAMRPQVMGTWQLPKLLLDPTQGLFISFASVSGVFGRFKAGASAAASRFLSSFSHDQRQRGLQSYCIAWSLWDNTGMSRGYSLPKSVRDRGYYRLHHQQGLASFLTALRHHQNSLFVGLDASNPRIRQRVETRPIQTQSLRAYLTPHEPPIPCSALQNIVVRDRFGQPTRCEFHQVPELPIAPFSNGNHPPTVQPEQQMPSTSLERQIAEIWQDVLGIVSIGIHDNFFELGGHSLLATQTLFRIRQAFKVELPLNTLFDAPTIMTLAQALIEQESQPGLVLKIANLREQLSALSPEQIRAKLQEKRKSKELGS